MDTMHQTYPGFRISLPKKSNAILRVLDWSKKQEKNRIMWLAVILTLHAGLITPFTVLLTITLCKSMFLVALSIGAIAMTLVTNLAALPTKITLPVFFLSLLIDAIVIGSSVIVAVSGIPA